MKSINHKRRSFSHFVLAFLLITGLAVFAFSCGEATAITENTDIVEGSEWFTSYCIICHGENADGKGNMASILNTLPLDLTSIAKRRNGVFPDSEIAKIIAGRENVPGHSTGEMPAWWETFKKSEGITDEKVLQEKIDNIVAYLKTIQK